MLPRFGDRHDFQFNIHSGNSTILGIAGGVMSAIFVSSRPSCLAIPLRAGAEFTVIHKRACCQSDVQTILIDLKPPAIHQISLQQSKTSHLYIITAAGAFELYFYFP